MGLSFNPFTGNFDFTGTIDGNTVKTYANLASFPAAATSGNGALAEALDTHIIYVSNGTSWLVAAGPADILGVGTIDSQTKSANGAVDASNQLVMQTADATYPGLVSTGTQTFAGNKTFTGTIGASNLSGTNTGDVTLTAAGSTPSANGASLSGQALTLQPADSTHPGIVSTGIQSFSGDKTFVDSVTSPDVSTTRAFTSLVTVTPATVGAVRLGNAEKISWRNVGDTADKSLTLNSSDHFTLNAPTDITGNLTATNLSGTNTGDVTLTAVGATPNANGASLSGQALTLQPADGTNPGVVTTGAQTIAGVKTFSSAPNLSSLTASQALVLDGSKNVTTLAYDTAATASTLAERDANGNLNVNNINTATTSTVSSVSPITLTANSTRTQIITGSTAQTIKLPNATTLSLGMSFVVNNNSTQTITVNDSTNTLVAVVYAGAYRTFIVDDISTPAGVWESHAQLPSNSWWGTNKLIIGAMGTGILHSDSTGNITSSAVDVSSADVTGTLAAGRFPALTGDVTTSAGSVATTVAKIQTTTVSGTTGSGNVVFSNTPTLTTPNIGAATGTSLVASGSITSPSFLSSNTPRAAGGNLRLANTDTISWRNASNSSDRAIYLDSSNNFQVESNLSVGANTITAAGAQITGLTASRAVVTDGSSNLSTAVYTNANTASAIVQRDGSGNFSAGTITANLTGNVTGSVTGTASGNTTYTANNHGVVVSSATNAMTVVAPDASTIKVLTSGGASADPSYQLTASYYTVTAGENLTANDAVYISSSTDTGGRTTGRAYKLDCTNDNRMEFAGFVTATTTSGQTATIQTNGLLGGFTGLTTGKPIFASTSAAGSYQTSAPTAATQWIIQLGEAISSTQIVVNASGSATATYISTSQQSPNTVTSVSGTYTITSTDYFLKCDSTSAGFTITLPTAVGCTGQIYVIKKISSDTNTITLGTTSSQTIDGVTTRKLWSQYEQFTVISDGSNWQVESHTYPKIWTSFSPTLTTNTGANAVTLNSTGKTDPTGYWCRDSQDILIKWAFHNGSGGAASGTAGTLALSVPTFVTSAISLVSEGSIGNSVGWAQVYNGTNYTGLENVHLTNNGTAYYVDIQKNATAGYYALSDVSATFSMEVFARINVGTPGWEG